MKVKIINPVTKSIAFQGEINNREEFEEMKNKCKPSKYLWQII